MGSSMASTTVKTSHNVLPPCRTVLIKQIALPKKMDDFDWLMKKLKIISEIGQYMKDGGITTEYGSHTALKLITVHYVSDMFTKIARSSKRKTQGFDGAVYVDLFAGTGLVKVKDTGDIVAGSAPCASMSGKGFDYSIMVEMNKNRCKILKKRMLKIPRKDDFDIVNGDANEVIDNVIDKIKSRFNNPIILAFVDPEGLEIKFRTLKALSDGFPSCDFLINANDQGASRVAGQARSGMQNRAQPLEEYLDDDVQTILWEQAEGKTIKEQYVERIQSDLGKPIGDAIPIRDDGNKVAYYLLYYTRLTGGGSAYLKAISTLKERMRRLDGNSVHGALDQICKRSRSMRDFC